MIFSILLACSAIAHPIDCSDLAAGYPRDECHFHRIQGLGELDVEQVSALAGAIDDRVVHDAAVFGWVEDHGQSVPAAQADALCDLLSSNSQRICQRRVESAHMQ